MNIVKKELFNRIDELICQKNRIIIGIDGMSGAGKSTLAEEIASKYKSCAIIHIDDYYDCSVGKLKHEEIVEQFRVFSSESSENSKHKIIIVEGVYCLEYDFDYDIQCGGKGNRQENHRL